MTEKQENILKTALRLFAKEGYSGISTSRIAKEAGVSEALIFRHFENKEGLLKAILNLGYEKALIIFKDILSHSDPKMLVRKMIELPFSIEKKDYEFWRLTYSLKWQTNNYAHEINTTMKEHLVKAFKKLGYKQAKAEAELLFIFFDGTATALLLHEPNHKKEIMRSMLDKYKL